MSFNRLGGIALSEEENRPEDNSDGEDKDSFSKFIHDNLSMDGMPDAPKDEKKAKDDEEPKPPTSPFTSRFGKPPSAGFPRFGASKSDDDDDDLDDDAESPFGGSTGIFGGKSPFSGDNKDRPSPFGGSGNSGSRFGGGGSSFGNSGSRFGSGNSGSGNTGNNPFGSRFGGDKNTPPPPSPFSPLGRLSNNKQPPPPFTRGASLPKSKEQKRAEAIRHGLQIFKELLPSLLLLLLLVYFITVFSQYQPDVLKGEINQLQQTITQQEVQIRQLQAQIETMERER